MSAVILGGCDPTILSSYLKALGILRVVAEQEDRSARGAWREAGFLLESELDKVQLREFLLARYAPTPIVTPWNGGSGFYPKDQQAGIDTLRKSQASRFEPYREAIAACERCLREAGLTERPKDDEKKALLQRLRNRLADEVIPWLDAAYVISEEPRYPALLGSGGNDGRLDFANNFMQRLAELLLGGGGARRRGPQPAEQLDAALFGGGGAGVLQDLAVGQFSPAAAGGINMGVGVEGKSRVNPWDYVLMLEGALLFAGAAVRRLETESGLGVAAFPFHVKSSAVGYGSAADADREASRGELWLPCWNAPASLAELRALFNEGRLELPQARRRAVSGLDATRALASLGVDRGIQRFERFAFLRRNGLAYLATHLGTLSVPERQLDNVNLLEKAADRLRDLERNDLPDGVRSARRALEEHLFRVSVQPEQGLTGVLMALGLLERSLRRTRKLSLPPLRLDPAWYAAARDQSPEFAVAAAFASLVNLDDWDSQGPLDNLVRLGLRRVRELGTGTLRGESAVPCSALAALLQGRLDEARLEGILFGLSCVTPWVSADREPQLVPLPPAFVALRAVTSPDMAVKPSLIAQLLNLIATGHADRMEAALRFAERHLYGRGVRPRVPAQSIPPQRYEARCWQAALLMPLPQALEQDVLNTLMIKSENSTYGEQASNSR